jgi:protein required for attachment to host cells
MKLAHETWVMILDGERFLLLENRGDEDIIDLRVIGKDEIENPSTREQGTERPGRMPDVGIGRSAVDQTDWHALEKERFARDVAERLRKWAMKGRFAKLVICADPKTLGRIRPEYHVEVSQRIVGELDKDLTAMPIDQIEKTLLAA